MSTPNLSETSATLSSVAGPGVAAVRRKRLLLIASMSLPFAAAAVAFGLGEARGAWMLVWGAIIAFLATRSAESPKWIHIALLSVGVMIAPLSRLFDLHSQAEIATVCLVPVLVSVLYIESFHVVLGVSITGWLSNILFISQQAWSPADIGMFAAVTAGVQVGVLLSSASARRARALDREVEAQNSQALRLSETRRAQAERLAIVGRLASGVAHEINNPLAFVKANVGMLQRSISGHEEFEPKELEEILDDTIVGIDRICQIVLDLKGFAREDSGVLEPVDLREAIQSAARLAAVRLPRDMRVVVEIARGIPLVRANQRKLAQVMLNLLVNAGEALEESRTESPSVIIAATYEAGLVRLSVTDNGPGFPKDVMARLFEPFFTTKAPGKGTGLGLALSREYVTAFGGTLLAQNAPKGGAQFVITLRGTAGTGETPLPGSLDLGPDRALLVSRFKKSA
ncbi:MAG: ATP-binding protein [Archangium sp.]